MEIRTTMNRIIIVILILNAHNKYKIIETSGNCIDLLRFNSFIILHRKRTNKSMKESTMYKF